MKNFEGKKKRKKKKDDCNCSVEDRLDDANKKNAIHIRDPLFFSDRKNIKIERSKEKIRRKIYFIFRQEVFNASFRF